MAVVYTHKRLDNNEVFYVGKGKTPKRAFSKDSRNPHWKNITNKTEYIVDILHSNVSCEEACELEKHLIFLYGRKDLGLGNLVNMTDGGEGTVGAICSDDTKNKISESKKNISDETRQKMSDARKDKPQSQEHIAKRVEILKGKTRSDDTRQKMSESSKGDKNGMYGKPGSNLGKKFTQEHKLKISEAKKGKKQTPEHIAKCLATRKENKLKKLNII